jgi:hypothetical protein
MVIMCVQYEQVALFPLLSSVSLHAQFPLFRLCDRDSRDQCSSTRASPEQGCASTRGCRQKNPKRGVCNPQVFAWICRVIMRVPLALLYSGMRQTRMKQRSVVNHMDESNPMDVSFGLHQIAFQVQHYQVHALNLFFSLLGVTKCGFYIL